MNTLTGNRVFSLNYTTNSGAFNLAFEKFIN